MLTIAATVVFLTAYAFITSEKFNRVAIVSAGAAAMFLIGATNSEYAFFSHEKGIDWNVIFLLLGMMIIVSVIHKTGLFEFLAITAIHLARGRPRVVYVYILALVALASAILDNVTTILLAVPMTFLIAEKLRVNPVAFILGEVFVSNIGGAATLIGDPPNIIIASKADLDFNDFLIHMAPIAVLVLVCVVPLLTWMFRRSLTNTEADRRAVLELEPSSFITDRVLLTKSIAVLTVVVLGFVLHSVVHLEPAVVAMMGAGLLVLISRLKPAEFALDVEWGTLAFFAGLFIMVGALVNVGALDTVADAMSEFVGDDAMVAASTVMVLSTVISGIVDNIPYVTSMIPVVQQLSDSIPSISNDGLWWALALGADLGGNLTIVGASANVVAIGLAQARGVHISFTTFLRYGAPITLVSMALAIPYVLLRYFS